MLTANRGLCGGYNSNVQRGGFARYARSCKAAVPRSQLEVSGKRGIAAFKFREHHAAPRPSRISKTSPASTKSMLLANRYLEDYVSRPARSAGRGLHAVRQRQPAGRRRRDAACRWARLAAPTPPRQAAAAPARNTNSCRRPKSILEEVVPTSFKVKLFKCFLDAAVSEQVARMVAMKAATENADKIDQAPVDDVQSGPAVADHRRDHGNHRRRRSVERMKTAMN